MSKPSALQAGLNQPKREGQYDGIVQELVDELVAAIKIDTFANQIEVLEALPSGVSIRVAELSDQLDHDQVIDLLHCHQEWSEEDSTTLIDLLENCVHDDLEKRLRRHAEFKALPEAAKSGNGPLIELLKKATRLLSSDSPDFAEALDTATDLERVAVEVEYLGRYDPERCAERRDLTGGGYLELDGSDLAIRYKDTGGTTQETKEPGESGWDEWAARFKRNGD